MKFLLMLLILFSNNLFSETSSTTLAQAYKNIVEAKKTSSAVEKNRLLNEALALYAPWEKEIEGKENASVGKLYGNIGDTYALLQDYAWAVLYYKMALSILPRDELVLNNLNVVENAAYVIPSQKPSWMRLFSQKEQKEVWWMITCSALAIALAYVWMRQRYMAITTIVAASIWGIVTTLLVLSFYLTPVEVVVMESTILRSHPAMDSRSIIPLPLFPGATVIIVEQDGSWLKVITREGALGYLRIDNIAVPNPLAPALAHPLAHPLALALARSPKHASRK